MTDRFIITAYWGPRREIPEALSDRFLRTLTELGTIHPALNSWLLEDGNGMKPAVSMTREQIAEFIKRGVSHEDGGNPTPINGFYFGAVNEHRFTSASVILKVHAGAAAVANCLINSVHIEFAPLDARNVPLFDLQIIKPALLALATNWNATWCAVRSSQLFEFEPSPAERRRPWFGLAWVTYISARFAHMIAPPHSAIVERVRNGGLLMVATEERFNVSDAKHLNVAREIEASLAPVNALPWPPDK